MLVEIDTYYIGNCKSNYNALTITTALGTIKPINRDECIANNQTMTLFQYYVKHYLIVIRRLFMLVIDFDYAWLRQWRVPKCEEELEDTKGR